MHIRSAHIIRALHHTDPRRWWRRATIVLLSSLLLACSVVRLAYNNADTLIYWNFDDAFDFDKAQSALVHQRIDEWFAWHRRTQLPRYAQWVTEAEKDALGPITPQLACERRQELQTMAFDALDHALPAMAEVLLELRPEQIEHMKQYQAKMNKKFRRDYLPEDPQDRIEMAAKFTRRIAEYFYGDFGRDERDALQADVAALPFDAEVIYGERLRQQQRFVELIDKLRSQHATPAQAQMGLHDFFHDAIDPPQEPQRGRMQRWIEAGCELNAKIHNRTTPEQKQNAATRLKSWHDDFLILARQS